MAHTNKETLAIGWCDSGTVEGRFMVGITNTILDSKKNKINIKDTVRVQGNQIARQRQSLWDWWAKSSNTDWLLWVDSDIIVTANILSMLWNIADKASKPVVSGTYFISGQSEQTLMRPLPALYIDTENQYQTQVVHPLPQNQIIQVDIAGFGLILMHRSIIDPVNKVAGELSVFGENQQAGDKFISEDVSFFRKLKKAGIPLYAHTGATVQHMKTFSLDQNYYNLFWSGVQNKLINFTNQSS